MKTSFDGLALIMRFEGFSAKPYRCPAGYWTIGYGHVLKPEECAMHVDKAAAIALLAKDAQVAERAVAKYITKPLKQHEFDALVSFTFNLGSGALQRSTLRRLINRGDEEDIERQWLRYAHCNGRRLPGLLLRRLEELTLYQEENPADRVQHPALNFMKLSHN